MQASQRTGGQRNRIYRGRLLLTVANCVRVIRVLRVLLRSPRRQVGNVRFDKCFAETTPFKIMPDAGWLICPASLTSLKLLVEMISIFPFGLRDQFFEYPRARRVAHFIALRSRRWICHRCGFFESRTGFPKILTFNLDDRARVHILLYLRAP